jgi:hypothetical protein
MSSEWIDQRNLAERDLSFHNHKFFIAFKLKLTQAFAVVAWRNFELAGISLNLDFER